MRLLQKQDIKQVTEIDQEAFPAIWPPVNYQHELQNPLAHYIVVGDDEAKPIDEPEAESSSPKGFARLVARMRQRLNYGHSPATETPSSNKRYILGFAGFWMMADEAHIISLAVRKTHRRRGIGELLLIATISLAAKLNARNITLEVRASNATAVNLYSKYGFIQVGLRRGYYIDNKEDAILMSTEDPTSVSFQERLQQLKRSHSRRWRLPLHPAAT
jgi:ribosomal-protein-alanine N-acetyltransferase